MRLRHAALHASLCAHRLRDIPTALLCAGLLDLEGTSLAPILVSLVNLNGHMLDTFGKGGHEDIRDAKAAIARYMTTTPEGSAAPGTRASAGSED